MGSVLLEVSEKSVTPLHPASYVATKLRVTYLSDLQVSDLGPETTYATFEQNGGLWIFRKTQR